MSERLQLSMALGASERTRPILTGGIKADGIDLVPTILDPSEIFWRQLRFADFDVSEMSLSSFVIARSRGDERWIGLPIFTTRRFFHTWILVRQDSGIEHPVDLKGKRVGVPEYQQSAAVWSRGILEHEFGVSPPDMTWFMERGPDRSHGAATGFKAPPGVDINQIGPDSSIGRMLASGELDATLLYLTKKNLVDRSTDDLVGQQIVRPLFKDVAAEKARYFGKTGIYPVNHFIVMRAELYRRHPWTAINLYKAFLAAKRQAESDARAMLEPYLEAGLLGSFSTDTLTSDPAPYGIKYSANAVETLVDYIYEQHLIERRISIEEMFAPSVLQI